MKILKKRSKHWKPANQAASSAELIGMIEDQTIGQNTVFDGPFGPRRLVYLDHTASGKSLKCIEAFIEKEVLPLYGNTHTDASVTARQTTAYRAQARQIVHECVGGDEDDIVIFHGSGTTACVHKLVHSVCGSEFSSSTTGGGPIVFVSPFEHHSNLLPWREAGLEVINVPLDKYGCMDMKFLEKTLSDLTSQKSNRGRLLLGCFSAGSNVTGALNDDIAVTILMHKFGGYAFFDYAAAGPHVKITMNPQIRDKKLRKMARKDAIYFSGHKFVGGPQTTGVLVAKRHVFRNPVPHGAGGGTVFFVTQNSHAYLQDVAQREEGGTPAIVSSIRLGLVLKLKAAIGEEEIITRESFFTRRALKRLTCVPGIIVLGNTTTPRLPIISFLIAHISSGYYLHYNFVVSLLNDMFGIQSRGGCMCAGPYAQSLLGIEPTLAQEYMAILSKPRLPVPVSKRSCHDQEPQFDMIFRPGFTRISFPYHASLEEVDFVIDAVEFVAKHGWKFLPLYKMNPLDGSFTHLNNSGKLDSLDSLAFTAKGLERSQQDTRKPTPPARAPNYQSCLQWAYDSVRILSSYDFKDYSVDLSPDSEGLRWFLLPSEAVACAYRMSVKPSPRPFSILKPFHCGKAFSKARVESITGQLMAFGWKHSPETEDLKVAELLQKSSISIPKPSEDPGFHCFNDDDSTGGRRRSKCESLDSGVGRSDSFLSYEERSP